MAETLDDYHSAMTMHLIGRSMADKYESIAKANGISLDSGRKPNSTFDSTVKIFRNSYSVFTGDGAGTGANDAFAIMMNPFVGNDMSAETGSIVAAGTTVAQNVPTSVVALPFWYRVIGKSMRFIPTQNLDTRAGTVIAAKNTAPLDPASFNTVAEIRALPWAREGPADQGAHVDLAHGPLCYRQRIYVQGGNIATGYDAALPATVAWDPDTYQWFNPAQTSSVAANQGTSSMSWPLGTAAGTQTSNLDTTGYCVIAGEGFTGGNDSNIGRFETVVIYEMINYSQLWQMNPVTVPLVPSTVATRGDTNTSDLGHIINKAEGAAGWLASNWRGLAKGAVAVGDTLATGASILGVPGAGAISAVTGIIGGFL